MRIRHKVVVRGKPYERYLDSDQLEPVQQSLMVILGRYGVVIDPAKVWTSIISPLRKFVAHGILNTIGVGVDWKIQRTGQRKKRADVVLTADRLRELVVELVRELLNHELPPRSFDDIAHLHRHIQQFIMLHGYRCPHTLLFWGRRRWSVEPGDGWEAYLQLHHPDLRQQLTHVWLASAEPQTSPP